MYTKEKMPLKCAASVVPSKAARWYSVAPVATTRPRWPVFVGSPEAQPTMNFHSPTLLPSPLI